MIYPMCVGFIQWLNWINKLCFSCQDFFHKRCSQKYQAINKTHEELSDLGSVKASQVCVFAGHRTETLGQSRLQNLCCERGSSDFQSIFTTSDAPDTHPVLVSLFGLPQCAGSSSKQLTPEQRCCGLK